MAQEKIIRELANQLGFVGKANNIYGNHEGYWFSIYPEGSSLHILTSLDYSKKGKESSLHAFFDPIAKGYRITFRLDTPNVVHMQMKSSMTTKATVEKTLKLLGAATSSFRSLGLANVCYNCGADGRHEAYRVGSVTAEVCPSCIMALDALFSSEKETLKVSGNYLTGAIGAVLGALLGSVVWLLVSYFGFVASFAGFAIAYMAYYGYRLFKGKVGKGMPVILILAVLLAIFAANTIEIAYGLVTSEIGLTLGEALAIAPRAFFDNELFYVGEVWKNIALGLVFGILGSYGIIRRSMDEAAFKHYEIEKL